MYAINISSKLLHLRTANPLQFVLIIVIYALCFHTDRERGPQQHKYSTSFAGNAERPHGLDPDTRSATIFLSGDYRGHETSRSIMGKATYVATTRDDGVQTRA